MILFNYRKPPLLPTPEEEYQKGHAIGHFDIDILPDGKNVKIYTYWSNFRSSDFEKFPNHPVLNILKEIYAKLKPEEFTKKPYFREFFNDKTDKTLIKIQSKKKYPKGTKFVAYLQLEIILRPYDFEKGELFFEYRDYGFLNGVPQAQMDKVLYSLLMDLHSAIC